MLTCGLFLSARMGIYQEVLYKEHGKHPREALFYSVSLRLTVFDQFARGWFVGIGLMLTHILFEFRDWMPTGYMIIYWIYDLMHLSFVSVGPRALF